MNLRNFEMRIDLGFDRDKRVVTAKLVEERAEIWEHVRSKGKGQRAKVRSKVQDARSRSYVPGTFHLGA